MFPLPLTSDLSGPWYDVKVKISHTPTQWGAIRFPCRQLQLWPHDYLFFHHRFYNVSHARTHTHTRAHTHTHARAHTHINNPPWTSPCHNQHTHLRCAAIRLAPSPWARAPGAPGEWKGSANKLSPGPGLRFQPSVRRGWGAMGTRSARGPVSIRSSGSTQWGPACRQHRWQTPTQKGLWMGRRLMHTHTHTHTHTHKKE